MTQTHIILISAAVALLTTGTVLAASLHWMRSASFAEGRWSRHGAAHNVFQAGHRCGEGTTARLEILVPYLEGALNVAPDQQLQWNAFVETVRGSAEKLQALCMDHEQAGTAPQRLARLQGAAQQGLAALTTLREATSTLYETFTDAQKRRFDELLTRRAGRHAWAHRRL